MPMYCSSSISTRPRFSRIWASWRRLYYVTSRLIGLPPRPASTPACLPPWRSTEGDCSTSSGRGEEDNQSAYRRALDLGVGNEEPSVRVNLANALRGLERYDEAQHQYEIAYDASDNPSTKGRALSNLARLLVATGQRSQAKAMMKDAFRLRGEGADPKGQAIIAKDLASLYAEEFDYQPRTCGLTSPSDAFDQLVYRATTTLMNWQAPSVGATVAQLDQEPEVAGYLLVDRLRTVMPGDWILATEHEPPAALQAALMRLWHDARGDPDSPRPWWIGGSPDGSTVSLQRVFSSRRLSRSERLAGGSEVVAAVREFTKREVWLARKRFYESARAVFEGPIADFTIGILEAPSAGLGARSWRDRGAWRASSQHVATRG